MCCQAGKGNPEIGQVGTWFAMEEKKGQLEVGDILSEIRMGVPQIPNPMISKAHAYKGQVIIVLLQLVT